MNFFPTTLMCVDDDETFLRSFKGILSTHHYFFKCFRTVEQAKEHLAHHHTHPLVQLRRRYDEAMQEKSFENLCKGFFHAVKDFVHNPNRYQAVSCILCDQDMPHMKGMELLDHVPPHLYKVIMSSVMTYKEATKALNESKINRFIYKEKTVDPEDVVKIFPSIYQTFFAQHRFYPITLFDHLYDVLSALATVYQSVEMYLISFDTPIYLMIDAEGHEKVLHLFPPDKTFGLLTNDEKQKLGAPLWKKMHRGERGFCTFNFDPERQPLKFKEAIQPLTLFETSEAAQHLPSGINPSSHAFWGLTYHITNIGKNVYSRGSFEAFKQTHQSGF